MKWGTRSGFGVKPGQINFGGAGLAGSLAVGLRAAWYFTGGGQEIPDLLGSNPLRPPAASNVISWAPTQLGIAGSFDGTNDYVAAANAAQGRLLFGSGSFSVTALFRSTATAAGIMVGKRTSATAGWELFLNLTTAGNVVMRLGDGSVSVNTNAWASMNDGRLHLATGVVNRATTTAYILGDGMSRTTGVSLGALASTNDTSATMKVGSRGADQMYGGEIVMILLHDRALLETEHMALWMDPFIFLRRPVRSFGSVVSGPQPTVGAAVLTGLAGRMDQGLLTRTTIRGNT
jgi:hypothetical protein